MRLAMMAARSAATATAIALTIASCTCGAPSTGPRPATGVGTSPAGEPSAPSADLRGSDRDRRSERAGAHDEVAPPLAIGWGELPEDPPATARESNRAALRLHERADYAASERAFAEIVAQHPSFVLARFNRACALSRRERADEAAAEIEALLVLDRSTIAPRLARDPDLENLRASPAWARVEAALARTRAAWARALAEGVPLAHETVEKRAVSDWGERIVRRTAQPGVWLEHERRFVPMGPRASSESTEAIFLLATALIDREAGVALTASGLGWGSEGGDHLSPLTISATRAIDGEELAQWSRPRHDYDVMLPGAHALPGGLAIDWMTWRQTPNGVTDARISRVLGEGGGAFDEAHLPRLALAQDGADVLLVPPREDLALRRRTLRARTEGGEVTIELAEAHLERDVGRPYFVAWPTTGGSFLFASAEHFLGGNEERAFARAGLSRVDLAAGTATLLAEGRGVVAMQPTDEGVYVQLGERLLRVGAGDAIEELPPGLVLAAGAPVVISERAIREWIRGF